MQLIQTMYLCMSDFHQQYDLIFIISLCSFLFLRTSPAPLKSLGNFPVDFSGLSSLLPVGLAKH